ncbi:hypothetical protein K9N68_01185 [Kovacikia minuta CCNUW1]|uniref:DUF6887 family protein n=1 Tax=Kovacikia minuta TaxID=2931930 RepID=UPI001CC923CE|nr:hypothetical protein [Kovacikia minuta]UBF26655.1 hypothetical protein K9N68_01185 [Kovacikia minuta CCNUW1]
MKPNYSEMSRAELKDYVLEHREDLEAIRALFHHPDVEGKWITMPPMFDENVQPIEENIRLAEEIFRKRIEKDDQEKRDRNP